MKKSTFASLLVYLIAASLVIPRSVVADVGGTITGVVASWAATLMESRSIKRPTSGEQVYPYNYKFTRALSSFDIRHNFVASYRYDLPFAKLFHQTNGATRGWAISGITCFSRGLPVMLVNPNDTALVGSFNNGVNGNGFADLDLASGSLQLNHNPRNGHAYFNTSLFSLPAVGSPGTASRRFFYWSRNGQLGYCATERYHLHRIQSPRIPSGNGQHLQSCAVLRREPC